MRSPARACLALMLTLAVPHATVSAQQAADIRRLNDAIVFDLFLNYELTEKNGNSSTLIDYLPRPGTAPFAKVELSSNYGGEDERATFDYGDRGRLSRIEYRRDDRLFVYDVAYERERVASVAIAGRKRIELTYRNDTLVGITRERTGGVLEYALDYRKGENRADIALVVVANGKRSRSPQSYFVTWDDDRRVTGFSLGTYVGRDITYSDAGDVATFSYFTHDDEQRTARWDYERDAKSSWTERRFKKLMAKRRIAYAAP